jgi:transcriptional regulator with XRE-family HTH domain
MAVAQAGLQSGGMEDLKEHLAEAFRAARLRKGLTQEALAHEVGVTTETISNTERGASLVSLPVFIKMAAALELSIAEIVDAPPAAARRKVTAKRRQLEGDFDQLGEQLSDSELDLLLGIGRLIHTGRRK